jgi:preprotein translocase subunit SecG
MILFFYLFPFRSSGSFFSTWYASFFWVHLGILLSYLNNKKKKNEKL